MLSMLLPRHEKKWLESVTSAIELSEAGAIDQAEADFEQAIAMAIQHRMDDQLVHTYLAYGNALQVSGQLDKSEDVLRRAITYNFRVVGQNNKCHFFLQGELGLVLVRQRKFAEAEFVLESAIELQQNLRLPMEPDYLQLFIALASCYLEREEWQKGETLSRRTYDLAKRFRSESDSITLLALALSMVAAQGLGNQAQAKETASRIRKTLEKQKKRPDIDSLAMLEHLLQQFEGGGFGTVAASSFHVCSVRDEGIWFNTPPECVPSDHAFPALIIQPADSTS